MTIRSRHGELLEPLDLPLGLTQIRSSFVPSVSVCPCIRSMTRYSQSSPALYSSRLSSPQLLKQICLMYHPARLQWRHLSRLKEFESMEGRGRGVVERRKGGSIGVHSKQAPCNRLIYYGSLHLDSWSQSFLLWWGKSAWYCALIVLSRGR